jgi:hypothetical protein
MIQHTVKSFNTFLGYAPFGIVSLPFTFFSFMTYHWISNTSKSMGATSGTGTTFHSRSPAFTPVIFFVYLFLFLMDLVVLDY